MCGHPLQWTRQDDDGQTEPQCEKQECESVPQQAAPLLLDHRFSLEA
jgi:hypothetical protein